MLRLFRSISRGRKENDRNKDGPWYAASSPERSRYRAVGQRVDDDDIDTEDDNHDDGDDDDISPRHRANGDYFNHHHVDNDDMYDEDEDAENENAENEDAVETPLLPIFSAAHLDRLPLYNITHAIRLLIVQRCETTLSWEQLRSPQVSQFLVKPVQSQIRADHFNRATLCALLANCLQFQKEGQMTPGNVGVCRTRALVSELLAMRLLKEFSTRELIDSLSYDFDLLQGMEATAAGPVRRPQGRFARVSTIEIAIRGEAKRFLAHPLVVQHLEAIWAGNIVFHSEADNLHRKQRHSEVQTRGRPTGYGTTNTESELPADAVLSRKPHTSKRTRAPSETPMSRRTVTLYNPREASLFKLSRLRVPRYRQIFSTLSFATMLTLFILVLVDRSIEITALEVLFWFWSIGYMLDEIVGFTEQGFGLYILSFWNAFDLGILFLFGVYYVLRLYGIVLAESGKHRIAGVAYDVLASTAILLFPRLFSVLDHYRYFSQLLIAFRMMVQDLMAVLILIVICCSGFFVALALSFAEDGTKAGDVVYSLFQILMGFTPTVWDHWANYNVLGKAIMAIFLTICHFLIVTILITVLTNSFMAIVKNAEEEHQFLFAVNTISMVKSDALFSYIPPTNVIGWALSPLRYLMPLRRYVKSNRTMIKVTHFPILFFIFFYERMLMSRSGYAPVELIERREVDHRKPAAFSAKPEPYATANRLREPSVVSFRKDRALDEVFRRPFKGDTIRTTTREMEIDRHPSANAVDQWMQAADNEGGASPPVEQPRSVLERLEYRRPKFKRANTSERIKMMKSRDFSTATRSVASDGNQRSASKRPYRIDEEDAGDLERSTTSLPQDTEADGDDEINEHDESDAHTPAMGESAVSIHEHRTPADESESEYFQTPTGPNSPLLQMSHAARARNLQYSPEITRGNLQSGRGSTRPQLGQHIRHASSGTILFAPQVDYDSFVSNRKPPRVAASRNNGGAMRSGTATPVNNLLVPGNRTPRRQPAPPKARPIMPNRQQTAPNPAALGGLSFLDRPRPRVASFNARALDLASEIGDNKFAGPAGIDVGGIDGMPASFNEQMMRDHQLRRRAEEDRRRSEEEEKGMVNRIMLARMHTLEEGFREVLKEIKDMSQNANSSRRESEADSGGAPARTHKKTASKTNADLREVVASGSGWQTPRTPIAIGRIGGNEKSKKVSPGKKLVRGNSKRGKDGDFRPGSSGRLTGPATASSGSELLQSHEQLHALVREYQPDGEVPSPDSIKSVVEVPKQEQDHSAADRPSRLSSGRPTTAIQDDALIDQKSDEE
ncbi:putative Ion transport domain-containing protein [Septoria linicola]|nr:putative Ion transport domain-containing protein [Septoria linicola]